MFSAHELTRYSRQMALPEFGEKGQQRLKQASVLVIGAGGLGCPVLQYLVTAGVGKIGIVDGDQVEMSNLHRQVIFREKDIGKPKAAVARKRLLKLNPGCEILTWTERFTAHNARAVGDQFDLIIDGSDNFATRYLVNDCAVELGKPFVSGAIFKFTGQVSLFNGRSGNRRGPTYRCLYPSAPPAESVPNCAEAGVIGVLPGIVGTLMACEAIKYLTGLGELLVGKLLTFDSLKMRFNTIEFERNESLASSTKILSPEHYKELGMCSAPQKVKEITPKELKRWMDEKRSFTLVDVREQHEKQIADIGGELIPLKTIAAHTNKLPKQGDLVIYCRSGGRSHHACEQLAKLGFDNTINLVGGVLAWSDEVDSAVQKY